MNLVLAAGYPTVENARRSSCRPTGTLAFVECASALALSDWRAQAVRRDDSQPRASELLRRHTDRYERLIEKLKELTKGA